MTQEHLSGLAILAIENLTAHQTNYDEDINIFAEQKACRVNLDFSLLTTKYFIDVTD